MLLFLAAVVEALFVGVNGPMYRSFGPVVEKRDGCCAAASEPLIVAERAGKALTVAKAAFSTACST